MSGYSKFNVYVGKYDVPDDGHLPLPTARLRIERATIKEEGLSLDDNGKEIAVIVEDGNFWPMIALLSPDDAERLGNRLATLGWRVWNATRRSKRNG